MTAIAAVSAVDALEQAAHCSAKDDFAAGQNWSEFVCVGVLLLSTMVCTNVPELFVELAKHRNCSR